MTSENMYLTKLVSNDIPTFEDSDFSINHYDGHPPVQPGTETTQNEYAFLLLTKGSLTIHIEFEKFHVICPAIISIVPGQLSRFEDVKDTRMKRVAFKRDFIGIDMQGLVACWDCMFGRLVIAVDEARMSELMGYTSLMEAEFVHQRVKREAVVRNLLNAFIIYVARLKGPDISVMKTDSHQNRLVFRFKELVDQHFREKAQVSHYADLLFVTPGHLNDVVRTTVGKNAKQIIDRQRVNEAKRLLFFDNYTNKDIAGILHFEDDAYFTRFFKKHTGQTPGDFQRTIREKYK